jgi:hypothetical protein
MCMLLGAATTLAVAWSLALWTKVPQYPRTTIGSVLWWGRAWDAAELHRPGVIDVWWGDQEPENPGMSARQIVEKQNEDCRRLAAKRPGTVVRTAPPWWGTFSRAEAPTGPAVVMGSDTAYGWPWPCLWYQVLGRYDIPTRTASATSIHGAWLLSAPNSIEVVAHDYRALPLCPILRGLFGDTALFGAGWFALLIAPSVVRRAIRRRRGACVGCGYDLRGTPAGAACPECGVAR